MFHTVAAELEEVSPTGNRGHPQVMGWVGATALGMGGSNEASSCSPHSSSLKAARPSRSLVFGLLLSWAGLPG